MARLIDTSVLITVERGSQPLTSLQVDPEPLAVASITAAELLVGIHRANTPQRRLRRETYVEDILTQLVVVPFDLTAARTHARIWAELVRRGQLIGAFDLQIAATALTHGYAVVTENTREFQRVPGLTVHDSRTG